MNRPEDGRDAIGGRGIDLERHEVLVELVEVVGALDQELAEDVIFVDGHTIVSSEHVWWAVEWPLALAQTSTAQVSPA
jgi:hypothetical protein